MRCRSCDYSLWNLATRECPECGAPFKPSEYTFEQNTVRFHCQHCHQAYYGNDRQGHLEPRTFNCVNCHQHIDMDEMVLELERGLSDSHAIRVGIPWFDIENRGLVKRLWDTAWLGMTNPTKLAENLTNYEDASPAIRFALTFITLGIIPSIAITALALLLFGFAGRGPAGPITGMSVYIASFIGGMIVTGLVFTLIWIVVTHALLRLGNPNTKPLATTTSAICFTCGPLLILMIPCFAQQFAAIALPWWVISATMVVKKVHGVSNTRGIIATITFPVIFIAIAVVLWMTLIFGATMFVTPAGQGGVPITAVANHRHPLNQLEIFHARLLRDASYGDGTPAQSFHSHAGGNPFTRDDFIAIDSDTIPENMDLDHHDDGSPYRIGDYVFYHAGLNLNEIPADTWLIIAAADPGDNDAPAPWGYIVCTMSGEVIPYDAGAFANALNVQNRKRRMNGLPEMPHPDGF